MKAINRIAISIFLMLFVSYCYFLQVPWNWNVVPRLSLAISIVEDGTIDIDKYHYATGDKSFYEGHYYSQAAPGMSFMAIPAVYLTKMYFNSGTGEQNWVDSDQKNITYNFIFAAQIATILVSGLLTALTGVVLFYFAVRLGAGLAGSALGALTFGLATPAWGWATAFVGQASVTFFLFTGFISVYCLLQSTNEQKKDIIWAFVSGALLSWSVVVDYTAAPAAAIIAIYGIVSARNWDSSRLWRVLISAGSGCIVFALPLFIYHYIAFGDPLVTGYSYHVTLVGANEGFYGMKTPKLIRIVRLLAGYNRGLLWFSPILAIVPYAIYILWKKAFLKSMALMIAAISLAFFVLNSAYVHWTAGASTGPRLIAPILPFLCLSLAFFWNHSSKLLKFIYMILFICSFLISLICVSVSMFIQYYEYDSILLNHIAPKFLEGHSFKTSLFLRLLTSGHDGSSHLDLLPLFIILGLGTGYILWVIRKERADKL